MSHPVLCIVPKSAAPPEPVDVWADFRAYIAQLFVGALRQAQAERAALRAQANRTQT